MKSYLFHIVFICCGLQASAQHDSTVYLRFRIVFGVGEDLVLNNDYVLGTSDSIRFSSLRFYVSNVQWNKHKEHPSSESGEVHLIDLADTTSLRISVTSSLRQRINELSFDLGIDSLTQTAGAMAGDLDPSKGMYWTWHSGYIQLKLEGTSSRCQSAKNEFQFHLGGYEVPLNTLQHIHLTTSGQGTLIVVLNLKPFVEDLDFKHHSHLMSPSEAALRLSQKVAKCFQLQGS